MSNDILLERMKNKVKSKHVIYTKFSLAYGKGKRNQIYCFFEGDEDKRYYGARIKFRTDKKYNNFTCGGKDTVKEIMNFINRKKDYQDVSTLYFIDKDYSNEKTNKNIYVTPYYSIENFYTAIESVKDILTNEFNIDENEDDFITALTLYKNLQQKFHSDLLLFNSWLSCQNDIRESTRSKIYLSIDDGTKIYFDKLVKDDLININDLSDLKDKNILENVLFPNSHRINDEVLNKKIEYFKAKGKVKGNLFRGKFEMKLLISFLQKLKNEICKKESNMFKKRHKCTFTFELINAISTLSQYAYTPKCLHTFLKKNV